MEYNLRHKILKGNEDASHHYFDDEEKQLKNKNKKKKDKESTNEKKKSQPHLDEEKGIVDKKEKEKKKSYDSSLEDDDLSNKKKKSSQKKKSSEINGDKKYEKKESLTQQFIRQVTDGGSSKVNKEAQKKLVSSKLQHGINNSQALAQGLLNRARKNEPYCNFLDDRTFRSFFERRPVEYQITDYIYSYDGSTSLLPAKERLSDRDVNLIFYLDESVAWRDYRKASTLDDDPALNYARGVLVKSR